MSVNTSHFSATITWQPSYSGGHDQTYHLSYRISEQGEPEWKTLKIPPASDDKASSFTLYNLQADTEYEFQLFSSNMLGNGNPTPVIRASTQAWSFGDKIYPTDASGATYIPNVQKPSGKFLTSFSGVFFVLSSLCLLSPFMQFTILYP